MDNRIKSKAPIFLVIIAFAMIYVVWGSTYFFIRIALVGIPPMLMGAIRFTIAGGLMLVWAYSKGDKIWIKKDIINSGVSGILNLFIAIGIVIWVERVLPSSMVAIMDSFSPIWLVVLDKANWRITFKSTLTIVGLAIGFAGVILLLGEQATKTLTGE